MGHKKKVERIKQKCLGGCGRIVDTKSGYCTNCRDKIYRKSVTIIMPPNPNY